MVNVNPLYTARELEHQLKDSGAKAIVIVENFAHILQQVLPHTELKQVLVTRIGDLLGFPRGALVNLVLRLRKQVPHWSMPGAITLKSALGGGLGLKLAPRRGRPAGHRFPAVHGRHDRRRQGGGAHPSQHGGQRAAGERLDPAGAPAGAAKSRSSPRCRSITSFRSTANCLLFVRLGAKNVLITNPRDFPGFVAELRKHKFFFISGVNTLFNALLHTPGFESLDFSALRITLGGGMAVQAVVAARWKKVTGNVLTQAWGLTETSPAACINPMGLDFNGSIGLPIPSTDVSIRDDDGVEMGTNEVGEICVFGPQLMRGYWNRPDETEKVMFGDWLRTGDIGRMDEKGFVFIEDRKKDMILVSGFNVYPNEIESVVAEHPGVLEVAAVAQPDESSGESVALFVVKKDPTLTAEALIAYCRANLTGYKVPKHVYFRSELPKTNVGKILRRALRDELRGAQAAAAQARPLRPRARPGNRAPSRRARPRAPDRPRA